MADYVLLRTCYHKRVLYKKSQVGDIFSFPDDEYVPHHFQPIDDAAKKQRRWQDADESKKRAARKRQLAKATGLDENKLRDEIRAEIVANEREKLVAELRAEITKEVKETAVAPKKKSGRKKKKKTENDLDESSGAAGFLE